MRWRLVTGALLLAAIVPMPAARASVPVLVVDGKGWGHGVGMAQDGALWMGVAGASTNDILGHFYPGTKLGRAGGTLRVAVQDVPNRDTVLTFPSGGEVGDAMSGPQSPGFPVRVGPGGQVHVWFDGAYHAAAVGGGAHLSMSLASAVRPQIAAVTTTSLLPQTSTTVPKPGTTTTRPTPPPTQKPPQPPPQQPAPPPPATATSGRALWGVPVNGGTTGLTTGHRYRGVMSITAPGALHLVDEVDVEQYLRGMGEVRDPSWPQASLRTQAIAARTYALRAGSAELCPTDRCQVYLGQDAEYPAMDKAVADSKGQVVTFGGGLATTVYSSNGGGFSATPAEGFGPGSAEYPYLKASPYTTKDPDPWTVKIALSDLSARFGAPGPATGAHVAQAGPSGRAMSVSIDGPTGATVVDAHRFAAGLGLRSTLFTLRVDQEDAAPAPPAPADLIQVPPDQLAAVDPPPALPVPDLPKAPVRIHVLGGPGDNDRLRWVAFSLMLISGWALAATRFGPEGMIPDEVRRWTGRAWPRHLVLSRGLSRLLRAVRRT